VSYYLSPNKFLINLRRAARAEKRAAGTAGPLAQYQNDLAKALGFQSWALLHKNVVKDGFRNLQDRREQIGRGIGRALPIAASEYAYRDIETFMCSAFERCAVYSVPSEETPNGYSHSSISISKTVREEFGDIYPEEFLLPAIKRIEEMGPWTEDESELIFE
jgi:hypothetical protein